MELITYETIVTPYLDFVHGRGVMGIVDFSGAFCVALGKQCQGTLS